MIWGVPEENPECAVLWQQVDIGKVTTTSQQNCKGRLLKIGRKIIPPTFYNASFNIFRKAWRVPRFIFKIPENILRNFKRFIRARNDKVTFIKRYGIQYRAIAGYQLIDGFLTESQAIELFDLAMSIKDNSVIVEIGSWQGKSSVILAKGIQNKKNAKLFCIDPFDASGDKVSEALAYHPYLQKITTNYPQRVKYPLLERFNRNMRINHVEKLITILHGFSQDFSRSFSERIDLLFIDGNHDYAAVKRDFEEWSEKLKRGGLLVLHDVEFDPFKSPLGNEDQTGPGRVAQELIVNSKDWCNITMVDNMLITTRC